MGQKASHPDAAQQQGVNPQSTDDKAVVKRHRKTRAEVEAVVATELSVLEQLKVERPDLACLDWVSENSVMPPHSRTKLPRCQRSNFRCGQHRLIFLVVA